MSDATDARCEGVFRCGTPATYCRKQAAMRRCGKRFCDGCAHWNRFAMDTGLLSELLCSYPVNGRPCGRVCADGFQLCPKHWREWKTLERLMDSEAPRGCPQRNDGHPCPNPRGHNALGWCDEHAAAYETMANNLRTEIDGYK